MPEIREGPTPFWGGRWEGAASGGRQAASKGRRAGGGGSKREREREREREGGRERDTHRLARESPKAGEGRGRKNTHAAGEAKHGKCVAICGQAQVENISYAAATLTHSGDLA